MSDPITALKATIDDMIHDRLSVIEKLFHGYRVERESLQRTIVIKEVRAAVVERDRELSEVYDEKYKTSARIGSLLGLKKC